MLGALDLAKPGDLLSKLDYEMTIVRADPTNSYALINALRDAYHLRQWIWHDRLKNNPGLQVRILGSAGETDCAWNAWVNAHSTNFKIVREICNGSKHFNLTQATQVQAAIRPVLDRGFTLDSPMDVLDGGGFFIDLGAGKILSVLTLLESTHAFWKHLFLSHPGLN